MSLKYTAKRSMRYDIVKEGFSTYFLVLLLEKIVIFLYEMRMAAKINKSAHAHIIQGGLHYYFCIVCLMLQNTILFSLIKLLALKFRFLRHGNRCL